MSIKKFRINQDITVNEIRLVQEDKTAKIISLEEGLALAKSQNQDLIEIFPDANPPVCKILHYEKFLYNLQKEEKEHRKKSKSVPMKEIQFSLTIGIGDYKTKINKILEFLQDGHKIQLVVLLKKKQMMMEKEAKDLIANIVKDLGENIKIEKEPVLDKKKCSAIIGITKKKNKSSDKSSTNTIEKVSENNN